MRKPGTPKTGGRKPGSKNKTTILVKEALEKAFIELGGVPALVAWGRKNQTEFYKLWGRMLPKEIKAEIDGPETSGVIVYLPDDGREQSSQTSKE